MRRLPLHTFKATEPLRGKVVSVQQLVPGYDSHCSGEVCSITVDHGGLLRFWEGQSVGIIPAGANPRNGKAYLNRLYSASSSRYGDDLSGRTTSFCVRRTINKSEEGVHRGICSNYLCDAQVENPNPNPTLPAQNPNLWCCYSPAWRCC